MLVCVARARPRFHDSLNVADGSNIAQRKDKCNYNRLYPNKRMRQSASFNWVARLFPTRAAVSDSVY